MIVYLFLYDAGMIHDMLFLPSFSFDLLKYSEPSVQGISRDLPFFSHRAEIP